MKKGFTLAEVLITLGIIGVVAAMTIPTLMNNINDQQLKVAWKKAYSIFNETTLQIRADNGGTLKGLFAGTDAETCSNSMMNIYAKYLKSIKSCNYGLSQGQCWVAGGITKNLNKNVVNPGWFNESSIVLNNGMFMMLQAADANCIGVDGKSNTCGKLVVDVNGFKSPNTIGKDIFQAYIFDGYLKPCGFDFTDINAGCIDGSTDAANTGWSCSLIYLQN